MRPALMIGALLLAAPLFSAPPAQAQDGIGSLIDSRVVFPASASQGALVIGKVPAGSRVLFLPQRPYLPLGSLRRALYYPLSASGSEEQLRDVLRQVGLEKFIERLDTVDDWSRILSLGEQQRLAFARVLLVRPDWIFLDEATSALDEPREQEMYDLLKSSLPESSIVSVGHRSTLFAQHETELHLSGDGTWQLRPITA